MRSVGEGFELILVAILAGIATDVIHGAVCCWFGLDSLNDRLRFWEELPSAKPQDHGSERTANEQRLDDSLCTQPSALTLCD